MAEIGCERCKYQHLDGDEEPCVKCTHAYTDKFEPTPQPTKADHIRKMSDAELAKFLINFEACIACEFYNSEYKRCDMPPEMLCVKEYAEAVTLKWLQEEGKAD